MNTEIRELLKGLRSGNPPPRKAIETYSRFVPPLPTDYIEATQEVNGGEGWVKASYLRLFPIEQLKDVNSWYKVEEFIPHIMIFASTGYGEAFAFDLRQEPVAILKLPFIPLDLSCAESIGVCFVDLIKYLSNAESDDEGIYEINEEAFGKEVHEIKPIVFGGDPVAPENKTLVPTKEHAELAVFWNRVYQRVKAEQEGSG